MTSWLDLPLEVKQRILQYVTGNSSIIYVPRDKRMKEDWKWLNAHHFHNVLLVSKNFVTAEDLAFAVLGTSKMTFNSTNELRKMLREVKSDFKNHIRFLHFRRHAHFARFRGSDSFADFSNIKRLLSFELPQLRQIYVSMPGNCVKIGSYYVDGVTGTVVTKEVLDDVLNYVSCAYNADNARARCPPYFYRQLNQYAAARFLLPKSSYHSPPWKIQGWLARLLKYAEEADIEVILQLDLCITNVWYPEEPDPDLLLQPSHGAVHICAEMSTKDYALNAMHNGSIYSIPQERVKELVVEHHRINGLK